MTRVMREERVLGNASSAMASLAARCGSAVMRHMVCVGEVLRECGTLIFPGFRRFLSTICFFVVRINHTGPPLADAPSSPSSESSLSNSCFLDDCSDFFSSCDLMCLRSAEEARSTLKKSVSIYGEKKNW